MNAHPHYDVLIIGAGISGIAAAHHMRQQCPDKSFAVFEAHSSFGGTWHLHRYPGARSDSDLYTFGYSFKPWEGKPIANRDQILQYLGEVIEEQQLGGFMHYGHRINSAKWDSDTNVWTLGIDKLATGEQLTVTTNFLWMCQGYYRHSEGYTPDWPDMERFQGQMIHPQLWPENLDYTGKKVVVIGSGATAATLIPAMARECAHVTMLQRSPAYFETGKNNDALATELRRLDINPKWTHEILRRKYVQDRLDFSIKARANPQAARQRLLDGVRQGLGPDYDVDKHFTPSYMPWQQRVAFVPDGDLFKVISEGHASVVTDEIERFTETGIQLKSGDHLDADIVVTATGFNLCALGDIAFEVDGQPVNYAETTTYRGMMFTGLPNLALMMGYSRFSWTLRSDILCDLVCRLLHHMDEHGYHRVRLSNREDLPVTVPLKESNAPVFAPNYLLRNMHLFPKISKHGDWQRSDDYYTERAEFPTIDFKHPTFEFARTHVAEPLSA